MDLSAFASVLGALGIGSFVGQYLIGAQGRRQVRSEVLRRLADCEAARWAGPSDLPDAPPFQQAIAELEKAAIVAATPRNVVEHYKLLAYVAWWKSLQDAEDRPLDYDAGGIGPELTPLSREAAWDLQSVVWHPRLGRIRTWRRIKERRRVVAEAEPGLVRNAVEYLGGKPLPPLPKAPPPPVIGPPPPPAPE